MYRKKHKNKDKFRKYPKHPAIDYEDFKVTQYGTKRYRMKCLECSQDKGYRSLGSIDLPCFNYESPDDLEFKECWSLSNLRPLWKIDNLRKGAKYEE